MEGSYLDKILLKKATIQSVALMLSVIMLSYAIKQYNYVAISASNSQDENINNELIFENEDSKITSSIETLELKNQEEIQLFNEQQLIFGEIYSDINYDILGQLGERYLIIRKPKGENLQIQLEDIYITKSLKIIFSGILEEMPNSDGIARVNGEKIFVGEPNYIEIEITEDGNDGSDGTKIIKDYDKDDPVNEITIISQPDNLGYSEYEILLQLNHVYVHILYEDENYYYIDLKRPKDVYDRIIVIDAGHGGKDPGALSKDGSTYEKDINLKILYELKELLDKDKIKVYYTRTKDETLFLRPRFTLANEVDCDFFISIHCNANNYTEPNGTEILYYNHVNNDVKTKDLAKILSEEMQKNTSLKNNGLIQMKDDDIFILANAKVPAVIIETGYMTNHNDLKYLLSKAGQQNIAKSIYNGIWRAYDELMPY